MRKIAASVSLKLIINGNEKRPSIDKPIAHEQNSIINVLRKCEVCCSGKLV